MTSIFTAILLTGLLFSNRNNSSKQMAETKAPVNEIHLKQNDMEKQNYTASILVEQNPKAAFEAISNFRAWWSEEIEGNTDKLGEVFVYHYKDVHICKMKLIEMVPDKKLVYQVLDNQFSFTKDKTEWIGTKLIFDISKEGDKTKVKFTHEGLVPEYECYKVCYDAWGNYINNSLYSLITTGKGKPNPKDSDGFNAELADKWKIKH
jgi:hypothetical protein